MVSSKQCSQCHKTKSITEFYRAKKYKDGYASTCSQCDAIKSHKYNMSDEGRRSSRISCKKYRDNPKNKDKLSTHYRATRYKRRTLGSQNGGHVTSKQLRNLKSKSINCYWCSQKLRDGDIHYDHYIPLSKGGRNSIDNIVVSCSFCNLSKHNKMPEAFANTLGRLL